MNILTCFYKLSTLPNFPNALQTDLKNTEYSQNYKLLHYKTHKAIRESLQTSTLIFFSLFEKYSQQLKRHLRLTRNTYCASYPVLHNFYPNYFNITVRFYTPPWVTLSHYSWNSFRCKRLVWWQDEGFYV